uniref:helix-turn-helix transcriptional regulator n=1 Tax=Altererythrobacter segetis TaxID=1104773 RepID=UPI00140C7686|nr:helix-turn-helix transcriptional regulator [Altererythrobacter segetis]
MTIRAVLESPTGIRSRSAARTKLQLATSVMRTRHQAIHVTIHDLSAEGMLIETSAPLKLSEKLAVEMPGNGWRDAMVVWSSAHFHGCRFTKPLGKSIVSAALLKSVPAPTPAQRNLGPLPPPEKLAAGLAVFRRDHGLTMDQLAKRLGVSRQTLWYWETGQRRPREDRLAELQRALDSFPRNSHSGDAPAGVPGALGRLKQLVAAQLGISVERVRIIVEL